MEIFDLLFKIAGFTLVMVWKLAWWRPQLTAIVVITWLVAASSL